MKFPKTVRFRKAEAKIYGPSGSYSFYRVSGYVAGERRMSSHATYAEARQAADKLVRDVARGNQAAALTPAQATDALAALDRLQSLNQSTGRRISLFAAVSEFAEEFVRLNGCPLSQAVTGYLSTVAMVKRIEVAKAVEEFVEQRKSRTVPTKEGKRPNLSQDYHIQSAGWLREFAETFPGYVISDLSKGHLEHYMAQHATAAPKTRNARRGIVRMLLQWCVGKDYLPATHRLMETPGLKHETAEPGEIDFYRPAELASLLANADTQTLPLLALAGLAGIRFTEICRLTWENVFRVPGHIEIPAGKSKTRSRRLVQICPSLSAWLVPYRDRTGPLWSLSYDQVHWHFNELLERVGIPSRRNGLRHSFISAHYALYADEGLTAQQSGNSPDVLHKNYKGLFTRGDGEQWFAVAPTAPANVVLMEPRKKEVF